MLEITPTYLSIHKSNNWLTLLFLNNNITKSVLFKKFYVQLLDYLISWKVKHDELIHETITLHTHEIILR